jgi:hypothetical protein
VEGAAGATVRGSAGVASRAAALLIDTAVVAVGIFVPVGVHPYAVGAYVVYGDPERQRLGDRAAGTIVTYRSQLP